MKETEIRQRPLIIDRESLILEIGLLDVQITNLREKRATLDRRLQALPKKRKEYHPPTVHDHALTVLKERNPDLFEECMNEAYARIEES